MFVNDWSEVSVQAPAKMQSYRTTAHSIPSVKDLREGRSKSMKSFYCQRGSEEACSSAWNPLIGRPSHLQVEPVPDHYIETPPAIMSDHRYNNFTTTKVHLIFPSVLYIIFLYLCIFYSTIKIFFLAGFSISTFVNIRVISMAIVIIICEHQRIFFFHLCLLWHPNGRKNLIVSFRVTSSAGPLLHLLFITAIQGDVKWKAYAVSNVFFFFFFCR